MKSMRAVEAGAEFLLAGQRGWNHYHSISKDINIVDNRALQQFHLSKSVYSLIKAVKKQLFDVLRGSEESWKTIL